MRYRHSEESTRKPDALGRLREEEKAAYRKGEQQKEGFL